MRNLTGSVAGRWLLAGIALFGANASAAETVRQEVATLAAGDRTLAQGEYADVYTLELRAGDTITVDMVSTAVDTYVALRSPSGATRYNDDHMGSRQRSQVSWTVEESGTWEVFCTSLRGGETGQYAFSIKVERAAAAPSPEAGVQRFSGALTLSDTQLRSGEYVDRYKVQARAGERLIIDLRSSAFDTYVGVTMPTQPEARTVENEDFEGSAARSLLEFEAPVAGEYSIAVTSRSAGMVGPYDLTVRRGEAVAEPAGATTYTGTLAAGDTQLGSGEWFDIYTFEGLPGRDVRVDLSGSFDTYAILIGPNGQRAENDDSATVPGHSIIETRLTDAGTYRVVVTSYRPATGGNYTVSIDQNATLGTQVAVMAPPANNTANTPTNSPPPADEPTDNRDVGTLSLGQTVQGALTDSDSTLARGEARDLFVFDGVAGQHVSFEVASSAFDPYIAVTLPNGEIIQNDDWQSRRDLARIDLTLEQAGRYQVSATSYNPRTYGAYTLRATAVAAPAPVVTPPSNNPGTGRTFGVFVGISDYPDNGPSDLRYTAQDAIDLYQGMQRVGMRREDAVLLTDAQATTGAVLQAIRGLGSRMGASDRLVFFYSGHGGRLDRGNFQSADPDNLDETLALYDDQIRDDDFAAALDGVANGTVLVVLDSCFSGGFSKDIITKPGRMGLFSSHEDVTSAVAVKFRAGGYLAKFMVEAVADRLSDDDQDGRLTALELSQYIYERYRVDVKSTGPTDKPGAYDDIVRSDMNLGYQQLIVDRGGVQPSQVLFTW
jgi:hypothetical protein